MHKTACRGVVGALLLGLAAPSAHAATPEDARRAYDAGRFTDAMGIWAALSRQGNPQASFGLGLMYDLGNGTPQDPQAAFSWYRTAAEGGYAPAEFNVGAMYDAGRGVTQSTTNAALWYAKAAAHGHHRAQFDLAALYERGDGVPKNPDVAQAWLRAAARGGITAAAERLKALEASVQRRPDNEPTPVVLASPIRNMSLVLSSANPTVELVWIAPPEPQPVHYALEVRQLGGSAIRTVYTASVTSTAVLVRLPPAAPSFYLWSVTAVARNGVRTHGEWNWFSVKPPTSTQQSLAQAPDGQHPSH